MATITMKEFCQACQELISTSDKLRDGWKYETFGQSEFPILVKKYILNFDQNKTVFSKKNNQQLGHSEHIVTYECHIIFSESYSNPVLYFVASKMNGKPLDLEEVWQNSGVANSSGLTDDQRWFFVTQQEHPVLMRPFFQLHPCHTSSFMMPVTASNKTNYIVAWLSIVLPAVGLHFDADKYYSYCAQNCD